MESRSKASEPAVAWRHLHPASLVVNLIPMTWRTFLRFWPLLVASFWGGSAEGAVNLLFVALFFALAVFRTVLHFVTVRYRMANGRLEIQEGLIARVERALDPARIQNVSIVQNVFHKVAGLVELRVEMAGATGMAASDGLLSALSVEEAEALRGQLGRPGAHVSAAAAPEEAIDNAGILEIVAYGVSEGRVGAAAVAIGLFLDYANQFSPSLVPKSAQGMGPFAVVGVVLVALAGGYALSVGTAVLRWYGARWWRVGDHLHFEAGLFTRRRMDIPLKKLQMVQIAEPILRRAMGFATLLFDTAASNTPGTQGDVATEACVPMVSAEDVPERVRAAFPGLDTTIDGDLLPCAPWAVARSIVVGALQWLVLAAVVHLAVPQPTVWALAVVGGLLGFLDARRQGWRVTERFIVIRRGFLARNTWVLPREKVQSVRWTQGPLLRLNRLGRVVIWFPGGRLALPDVAEAEAAAVFGSLRDRR